MIKWLSAAQYKRFTSFLAGCPELVQHSLDAALQHHEDFHVYGIVNITAHKCTTTITE